MLMPFSVEDLSSFIERVRTVVRSGDRELAARELLEVPEEDLASAVERMELEESLELLTLLPPENAAYILVELPTENARALLAELPDEPIAHFLDILPMDDALEFREELGEERFDDLLEIIPVEDAQEIRRLLGYPEDSVGRLMTERFFEVKPETTMAELLSDIRMASDEKYETVNDVYVLSLDRHLIGVFSLRKAIRSAPDVSAREIMRADAISVQAESPAEDAARMMSRYGFYALPVLDARGRMVGIFTGDDAQAIIREADTEDVLKLGAVSGDVEAYLSLKPFRLAAKRLPWLGGLFLAETLTGMVLRHYGQGGELNPVVFYLPLLIGAGGNSGSQTTTMVTRALAIGELGFGDWWRVLRKEVLTSFLVGGTLGILGLLRALGWGTDPMLCFAIGLALPLIVLWASSVGALLPLAAKRLRIDPAVMSAPFISTFVDATGLIIYFEIVKMFFGGRLGPL